ncbi:MAG: hypothetical protein HC859_13770, partial [Bacteroidia bacterium]|nr:hypothetical protein [Bacteroidia bacterium]
MRLNWLLPMALMVLASASVHAQKKNASPSLVAGRELYLSRMQAAEALIQLGQTAEAREVLNAVKAGERQLEWKILSAIADRSARTIVHHTASVAAVAFSHDGQWVATGSADSTIVLWHYPAFEKVHVLRGHQGQVSTLAFSPDGSTLASGSTDKTVKCWNVTTGAPTKTFTSPFTRGIYQVRFSPDGKKLAVCTWELLKDKSPPVLGYTVV